MTDQDSARAWISSREATRRLGIKPETLYAYVSRGLVASAPGSGGKGKRYSADDVARLRARHDARSGHGPVAAGALRWGEPVLETALSDVSAGVPRYRGRSAVELAAEGAGFERVAQWLILGALPAERPLWLPARVAPWGRTPALGPSRRLPRLVALVALAQAQGAALAGPAELGWLFGAWPWLAVALGDPEPARPRAGPLAATLLGALRVRPTAARVEAVDRALVLLADHELNASTFAARVAASTGASLGACCVAGLAALTGGKHGGACDRVEALLGEVARPDRAREALAARVARGDAVPGFGHPLYPEGDPRGATLLELAAGLGSRARGYELSLATVLAARELGQPAPTVDVGLVVLCSALGAPTGTAAGLFALARIAGWAAHALEQRATGVLLRPRARYVGA